MVLTTFLDMEMQTKKRNYPNMWHKVIVCLVAQILYQMCLLNIHQLTVANCGRFVIISVPFSTSLFLSLLVSFSFFYASHNFNYLLLSSSFFYSHPVSFTPFHSLPNSSNLFSTLPTFSTLFYSPPL